VTLLLVEDEKEQAEFVVRLIREQQSTVREQAANTLVEEIEIQHVGTLSAAFESLEERTPDVILLDLMLPDSRGIETVERVVEHTPTVPVVVLTGQNEMELGVDALRCGAQEYLSKANVTGEAIVRTLRYAIERSRNQRTLVDRNHRLALLNQIVREDIRADLSMIVGLTDQLEGTDADKHTIASLLETARHAADRTDIAATVVDVISATDLEPEPCDLDAVLETEVRRLRTQRDVEITIERPESAKVVLASPMLGVVFTTLFEAIIDRSDQPTPEITVTIRTTAEDTTVELLEECANPIDDETQHAVDPDVHFDSWSRMGLRRYLVETVLESVGGSLETDTTEKGGARMTVTLTRRVGPDSSVREDI